jgi:hypothetical protein
VSLSRALRALTLCLFGLSRAASAQLPPTDVMMPGSQPPEIVSGFALAQPNIVPFLHSDTGTNHCSTCHISGTADHTTEITALWRGSMMASASRDPLTWAALAVAEQDFPGAGDTCIRCHVPKGWVEGRSVPSDGSALQALDADGVTCHLCHRLANPDDSETGVTGVQSSPFVAAGGVCATSDVHEGVGCDLGTGAPCSGGHAACVAEAFHGNAMFSIFQDNATSADISRLGPYADADAAPHLWKQAAFQRDAALCGTCHDVSSPVVGDLAPSHGRLVGTLPAGSFSGVPGDPVATKAALRNPPYAYGVEQRTFSEWLASSFATAQVSSFASLPADLQAPGGIVKVVSDAAAAAGGNYADATPRRFTCQSCHLRPVSAAACSPAFSPPTRADMPLHDLTGANAWAPLAILYLDGLNRLRLGGGVPDPTALSAGAARATAMLRSAVSLQLASPPTVLANTVRVVNLAGHKLFTGYPEGRRMWLNVKWYDAGHALLREDGAYGALAVTDATPGSPTTVDTLLDPVDPHTRVYGVASGISQAWAQKLLAPPLSLAGSTPLDFDRQTGVVVRTLADAASAAPGTVTPSSHLALNDAILSDDRIPPWGMDYAEAHKRNALPVPETLYLGGQLPGPGAVYGHVDEVPLDPPVGAVRADVSLLYQTTSWEYVQFVWKANAKGNAFLATVGDDLLEAWLQTQMAAPVVVATTALPEPDSQAVSWTLVGTLAAVARTYTRSRPSRSRPRGVPGPR